MSLDSQVMIKESCTVISGKWVISYDLNLSVLSHMKYFYLMQVFELNNLKIDFIQVRGKLTHDCVYK